MIFTIFFAIAVALIGGAVVISIKCVNKNTQMGLLLLMASLATFCLYLPTYLIQKGIDNGTAIMSTIVNVMRTFTLDASNLERINVVESGLNNNIIFKMYVYLLGFMHIAMPVVLALTAYYIVVYWAEGFWLKKVRFIRKDVHIFSEYNSKSLALAEDIIRHRKQLGLLKKTYIVFANFHEEKDIIKDQFEGFRVYTVAQNITKMANVATKSRRRVFYYNISADESRNLSNTYSLIDSLGKKKDKNSEVTVYIFTKKAGTSVLTDNLDKGDVNLLVLNENELSAIELMSDNPLYEHIKNNTISMLILGFGEMGLAVYKTAMWMGQIADVHLKVTIVDPNVYGRKSELEDDYPEMFSEDYDVTFCDADFYTKEGIQRVMEICGDATYIAITNEGVDNIELAMNMRRAYLMKDSSFTNRPFIGINVDTKAQSKIIETLSKAREGSTSPEYDIEAFGSIDHIYAHHSLQKLTKEEIAKNVNILINQNEKISETMKRYNSLEFIKRMNRSVALHIPTKLFVAGFQLESAEKGFGDSKSGITKEEYEERVKGELRTKLVRMEYNRYVTFYRMEGWSNATQEEMDQCGRVGIKAEHAPSSPILRKIINLKLYDELAQDESVDLEKIIERSGKNIDCIPDVITECDSQYNPFYRDYKITNVEK